jgi:hypothetical protein
MPSTLPSNRSTGFTGVVLKAYRLSYKRIEIVYGSQSKICPDSGNIVQLNIIVNRKVMPYTIDLHSGEFIGFSKEKYGNKLRLSRSLSAYEYD